MENNKHNKDYCEGYRDGLMTAKGKISDYLDTTGDPTIYSALAHLDTDIEAMLHNEQLEEV